MHSHIEFKSTSNYATLIAVQLSGVFLLGFLFFGVALPAMWHDAGFPAVLKDLLHVHARIDAFKELIEVEGGVNRFAGASSATMTLAVMGGLGCATLILGSDAHPAGSRALPVAALIGVVAIVCALMQMVFAHSLRQGWTYGFHYAGFFFQPTRADEFGTVAALCMGTAFALGVSLRVFGGHFHGLYPKFAYKAVPRALLSFFLAYGWFRWIINPTAIQAASLKLGLVSFDTVPVNATSVQEDHYALIASVTHTFALVFGMVVGHVFTDHFSVAPHSKAHVRFAVVVALGIALATGLSSWISFATQNGVRFVSQYAGLAFADPAQASSMAALSYLAWFLMGALLNEIQSIPAACIQCIDDAAPDLRTVGGVKVETAEQMAAHGMESDLSPALGLLGVSFCMVLYVADPAALGVRFGQLQALGTWATNVIPRWWEEVYDTYSREQIFFLTLPMLFLTEVPLAIFTIADLLKLKRLDKYRMHYSKLDAKRPRLYPTLSEMGRCLKYHFINLLGVYTPAFLLGVGGGCYFGIYPYQMQRELPSYWLLELFVSTIIADQLFYWIHRVAHMKQFYARLHKMHHEWIYTIALAHHYMDPLEAALFMIPPVLPPMLLGSHIVIVWCTMWWVQINAILGHSAFCVPFLAHLRLPFLDGRHHDLHHLRFNVNYSAVYDFTDKIWGTHRYENIVYVDGLTPELACDHTQQARALAGIADDDDPYDYDEVRNDATYVRAKGVDAQHGKKIYTS